jgi:hypothetical protein
MASGGAGERPFLKMEDVALASRHVCFWHKADVPPMLTNVRFRGQSGHQPTWSKLQTATT